MAEQNQEMNLRALYPRLLSFGIAYGDLERIRSRVTDWTSFSRAMTELGDYWEQQADNAFRAGRLETPGQHWLRAAAYYHFAQLRLEDSPVKENLRLACRQAYVKYSRLADPPIIRCEIPFDGANIAGYLRTRKSGPCVILIGGLDSAKEVELHYLAEIFLARCCSVFYFDGPGQGELYKRSPLTSGFEKAVSSVISFLTADPRVQPGRFGCLGVSFGGYLACLSSAANPQISACISMSGFFDHRILVKLPPFAREIVRNAYGLCADADLNQLAPLVSLEPHRGKMKSPLLIVHGTADHLVDSDQVEAVESWASGSVEKMVLEGSEHVCCDRFNQCLPYVGDWMTAWLMRKNESVAVV